LAGRC